MSEEINLTTLFKNVAKAIKKHSSFVAALFIIGFGLSFCIVKFVLPAKYFSQSVFKSSYLDTKTIEMSLDHINAVIASKQISKDYNPYEGCIEFTVENDSETKVSDQLLAQPNTYVTILVKTEKAEQLPQLAGAIKQFFDTNSAYISIRDTKHQVLVKMIEDLDDINENIYKALTPTEESKNDKLLMLPSSPRQVALAETILSRKEIVSIVQEFSPPEEKGKKALTVSVLIGLGFVGMGFLIKAFIKA